MVSAPATPVCASHRFSPRATAALRAVHCCRLHSPDGGSGEQRDPGYAGDPAAVGVDSQRWLHAPPSLGQCAMWARVETPGSVPPWTLCPLTETVSSDLWPGQLWHQDHPHALEQRLMSSLHSVCTPFPTLQMRVPQSSSALSVSVASSPGKGTGTVCKQLCLGSERLSCAATGSPNEMTSSWGVGEGD